MIPVEPDFVNWGNTTPTAEPESFPLKSTVQPLTELLSGLVNEPVTVTFNNLPTCDADKSES